MGCTARSEENTVAVDSELTQLFANLGEAIRDVPAGPEHEALYQRFFAIIICKTRA